MKTGAISFLPRRPGRTRPSSSTARSSRCAGARCLFSVRGGRYTTLMSPSIRTRRKTFPHRARPASAAARRHGFVCGRCCLTSHGFGVRAWPDLRAVRPLLHVAVRARPGAHAKRPDAVRACHHRGDPATARMNEGPTTTTRAPPARCAVGDGAAGCCEASHHSAPASVLRLKGSRGAIIPHPLGPWTPHEAKCPPSAYLAVGWLSEKRSSHSPGGQLVSPS